MRRAAASHGGDPPHCGGDRRVTAGRRASRRRARRAARRHPRARRRSPPAPDGAPVATPAGGPAPAGTPLPAAVGAPALDGLGCVAFPGAATAGFAGDVAGSLAVAAAEGFPAPAGSPAAGVAAREGLPARRPVTALAAAGVAPRAVGRAGRRRVRAGVLGRGRPQRRDRRDGAPGDRGADRDDQRGLRGQREPGRSLGAGDDARCDAACAAGAPAPVMPWSMPATTAPRSVRISASCASSGARSPWISGSPLRALVVRDVQVPELLGDAAPAARTRERRVAPPSARSSWSRASSSPPTATVAASRPRGP